MTLATKNGSIILKDGKLAESCGCCEGGWYCCSAPACVADTIQNVSVTVAAQDYLQSWEGTQLFPNHFCETQGGETLEWHFFRGFVGSRYSGTFSLAEVSGQSQWRYDFASQPDSECAASLVFAVSQSQWTLAFSYPSVSYEWQAWLYYPQQFRSAAKSVSLTAMKCRGLLGNIEMNCGTPSGAMPHNSNAVMSHTRTISGQVDQCATISVPGTHAFTAEVPAWFGGQQNVKGLTGSMQETGSRAVTVALSVSQ